MSQVVSMITHKPASLAETRLAAFNTLAARYQDEAYTLAFYLLGDDTRAAQATQSALADLYRSANVRPEDFRLEVLRRVIAASRRAARAPSPRGKIRHEIFGSLLDLKENERWTAVLVDVIGLRYDEAARVLDCSTRKINHWLAQARVELAPRLLQAA